MRRGGSSSLLSLLLLLIFPAEERARAGAALVAPATAANGKVRAAAGAGSPLRERGVLAAGSMAG